MPRATWVLLAAVALAAGCRPPTEADVTPQVADAAATEDALAISDELERLIADSKASEDDRVYALEQVRSASDDGSAGYAFARAAVAGRVAELRGVKAGKLVSEAEGFAEKSIERDPEFRDKAASRMLASLWVMAPPRLLEHGDSEKGLSLLEDLTAEQPQLVLNRLRLAEGYIFLGDAEAAVEHLCVAIAARAELRADDDALLSRLVAEASEEVDVECEEAQAQ